MSGRTPGNEADAWAGAMRYIVGRKRAEEALGFLAALSRAVDESPDLADAVPAMVERVVPFLADWCAVHRHAPGGDFELLARKAVTALPAGALGHLLDPTLAAATDLAGEAEAPPAALHTALSTPIRCRGRWLGVLTLARLEGGRPAYQPAEAALIEELSRRLGVTLELIRLHG